MPFAELLTAVPTAEVQQSSLNLVKSVEFDSRYVSPGSCFVCRQGLHEDGHKYVREAIDAGAVAVVAERPVTVPARVGLALVLDGRQALAALARRIWAEPDLELGTIGVTGTDGKTTTSHLIDAMLQSQGRRSGSMTTVGISLNGESQPVEGRLTTPEAPRIAQRLRWMAHAGAEWVVLEVASHALELRRVEGFAFDRAVITNITRDHLDIHGSVEGYRRAKRRLLDLLDATKSTIHGRTAVLNADDPVLAGFAKGVRSDVLTFASLSPADVRASWTECGEGTQQVTLESPWGRWTVPTRLVGPWNAANIAAAAACVGSITGDLEAAVAALPDIAPIRGRMQLVDEGQPFRVVVDFAHTPAALEAVLRSLRRVGCGRLIVVFGSAGDQDRGKRPLLGRAAAMLADYAVVTDEDPRSEDPQKIADAIAGGARKAKSDFSLDIIPDRRQAIRCAIEAARPGDIVLLAGKGHEMSIAYRDRNLTWDEAEEARAALATAGYSRS